MFGPRVQQGASTPMNDRGPGSASPAVPDATRRLYIDRIHLWMGLAATCVLLPFAIYNAIQGRPLIGLAMAAIASLFVANMVAVLRKREPPVSVFVIYLISVGAIALSTFTFRGLQGVLWGFPAVVLFHFLAERRVANLLNASLAVLCVAFVYPVASLAMALRVGATLALTVVFTNIFSRVIESANRALDDARETAERANLAKSQFLANMSHELRTPLNAIIGYTELLHEDAQAEQRQQAVKDLERIASASRHLLQMIDELLDLAKIEASRIVLSPSAIALPAFVEELSDAARPLAKKKDNMLVVELADDARALPLRADATRLRQCMLNLLSNACKFTEKGEIALRVAGTALRGAPAVALSVRDTGIGMTEEQLGRVFRPFEQADASTPRRFGGTGLGLAITSQLAELMGGEIAVQSAVGRGSTFTLTLPLAPPTTSTDTALPEPAPRAT
jgi:signal transduction histidine kinase